MELMMRQFCRYATLLTMMAIRTAWSASSVLHPSADAFVAGRSPDSPSPANVALLAGGNDTQPQFSRKVYLLFELDESNPVTEDAELRLTVFRKSIPKADKTLRLYGLRDGVPGDAAGGWSAETLTWENAPANVEQSGSRLDEKLVVVLGEVDVATGSEAVVFSGLKLGEFLKTDSNGWVTLILAGDEGTVGGFVPMEQNVNATRLVLGWPQRPDATATRKPVTKAICPGLILRSGFEPGTRFVKSKIQGTDTSVPEPNDWSVAGFGLTRLPDGNPENRRIELVPDPAAPANTVLRNWHRQTNKKISKTEIYRWKPYQWHDELTIRFRIRFPRHMQRIEQYENGLQDHKWSTDFIVLTEFWMDAWPFPEDRVNFSVYKKKGVGQKLHWVMAHSDTYKHGQHVRTWQDIAEDSIEFDRWYTVEIYVKVGDEKTGRVTWSYQPHGGEKVVRTVNKETHAAGHPPPKGRINGCVFCKLYTNRPLLDWVVRQTGKPMVNDYDDVELWNTLPKDRLIR